MSNKWFAERARARERERERQTDRQTGRQADRDWFMLTLNRGWSVL